LRAGRRPLKSAVQGLHHSLPFHALSASCPLSAPALARSALRADALGTK
jgi:hypothetical protein